MVCGDNSQTPLEYSRTNLIVFAPRTGASLFERKDGTKAWLRRSRFDNLTEAVQEHGTYWDEGKAVRRGGAPTALLFVALWQRLQSIWSLQAAQIDPGLLDRKCPCKTF